MPKLAALAASVAGILALVPVQAGAGAGPDADPAPVVSAKVAAIAARSAPIPAAKASAAAAAKTPARAAAGKTAAAAAKKVAAAPNAKAKAKRKPPARPAGRNVAESELRKEALPRPSGNLHLYNTNTHEELKVNIYNPDFSYDAQALTAVSHLLRCRRTDDERPIEPRLLTILSTVYDHYGGKQIEVLSGYRNQRRVSSNHYKGKASDIRIAGVHPKRLRDYVATLDTGGMGLGIYPRSGFVHVDIRPLPSYRWIDYSRSNPNSRDKQPPRGWKRKKLTT